MNNTRIFSYASRLREAGNAFLLAELAKAGLRDFAPSHGDILHHLLAGTELNMSELALRTRRTKSTVTALVTKLERGGYVERIPDPRDSRGVRVRLTDKGRALEPAFQAISAGLQELITSRLSEDEAERLEELLARCVQD
ncbi:MarR family transcriptional regulator [uncultured Mailhella sp.]|uniref:MarR family winged helix-turn-helix transcriptional regulator n=1 Tax=uncultured Mailhella sp. TaxID=1981031 RepID=UPI002625E263|nr:MarR family transcriptional regulator [uncultured Mailhella sp.]